MLTTSGAQHIWKAIAYVKSLVSSETLLWHYDIHKPVFIQVDASKLAKYGLGTALLQNAKPVAFMSKGHTPVEECYTNIERC